MAEKILVVDDEAQTLRLVGIMLERQGYRVVFAQDGAQAIRAAQLEQPDAILLDVMMPEMDGYEVTRLLRKNPETAHIPILMFTAQVQPEARSTGFEAGADDYLTKPIHPAELVARLRVILSNRPPAPAPEGQAPAGHTVGLLAARGGLGVSTLALNLAITFHQMTSLDVIAAELYSGQGSWAAELSLLGEAGLTGLLEKSPDEINAESVEWALVPLPYGIRLLMASARPKDAALLARAAQLEAVVAALPGLARLVLLDLGAPSTLTAGSLVGRCDEILLITEPFPSTVQRTRLLAEDLAECGFGKGKPLTLISINRTRTDVQLPLLQMQDIIQLPVAQVIPPVPESAFQAASRGVPICQIPGNPLFIQQLQILAAQVAERVTA